MTESLEGNFSPDDYNQDQPLWTSMAERYGDSFNQFVGSLTEEYFELEVSDEKAMEHSEQFRYKEANREAREEIPSQRLFSDPGGFPDRGPAEVLVEEVIYDRVCEEALEDGFDDHQGMGSAVETGRRDFSDLFYDMLEDDNYRIREGSLSAEEKELIGL